MSQYPLMKGMKDMDEKPTDIQKTSKRTKMTPERHKPSQHNHPHANQFVNSGDCASPAQPIDRDNP